MEKTLVSRDPLKRQEDLLMRDPARHQTGRKRIRRTCTISAVVAPAKTF